MLKRTDFIHLDQDQEGWAITMLFVKLISSKVSGFECQVFQYLLKKIIICCISSSSETMNNWSTQFYAKHFSNQIFFAWVCCRVAFNCFQWNAKNLKVQIFQVPWFYLISASLICNHNFRRMHCSLKLFRL